MALVWMEDFEGYETPKTSPLGLDTNWMPSNYLSYGGVRGAAGPTIMNSTSTDPYQRVVLHGSVGTTGQSWAITRPLDMTEGGRVYHGFKVVDVPATGGPANSMVHFGLGSYTNANRTNFSLVFGVQIVNRTLVRISYIRRIYTSETTYYHVVTSNSLTVNPPMTEDFNTIEYFVERNGLTQGESEVQFWVNNRRLYQGIIRESGSLALACAVVAGQINRTLDNTQTTNLGTFSAAAVTGNMNFGTTDCYVRTNVNERLGKVRVASRTPSSDVSTNLTPSDDAPSGPNAEVLGLIPPNLLVYLYGTGIGATDLYGSLPFDGLGSQAVQGSMFRILASKDDPVGYNVQVVVESESITSYGPIIELDTAPTYQTHVMEVNPSTSLPWTPTQANLANIGLRITGSED